MLPSRSNGRTWGTILAPVRGSEKPPAPRKGPGARSHRGAGSVCSFRSEGPHDLRNRPGAESAHPGRPGRPRARARAESLGVRLGPPAYLPRLEGARGFTLSAYPAPSPRELPPEPSRVGFVTRERGRALVRTRPAPCTSASSSSSGPARDRSPGELRRGARAPHAEPVRTRGASPADRIGIAPAGRARLQAALELVKGSTHTAPSFSAPPGAYSPVHRDPYSHTAAPSSTAQEAHK